MKGRVFLPGIRDMERVYWMFDRRINIFVGHFGSGKTEVAVNFALGLRARHEKTAIVDLDIVNPFFRTADVKEYLEDRDIWVITPRYANTNVDVPALPAEINTLFEKKEYRVVLDIGGDDLGARVLARYNEDILNDDCEVFAVINTKRPMTDTVQKIEDMICELEQSSRLKVTRLVNNTNMLQNTAAEDIVEGQAMIEIVSKKLEIPVGFISGFNDSLNRIRSKTAAELFFMDKQVEGIYNICNENVMWIYI